MQNERKAKIEIEQRIAAEKARKKWLEQHPYERQ